MEAPTGSIGSVSVLGSIAPVSPRTEVKVRATSGIDRVDAASMTAAKIVANTDYLGSPGTGNIKRVTTIGEFSGTIAAQNLTSAASTDGVSIGGSTSGTTLIHFLTSTSKPINIGGNLASGTTLRIGNTSTHTGSLNGPVTINGSLAGTIQLASSTGLASQIIVNAANSGGAWTGNVTLNGSALSGSSYSNTSASLGGGAVGLAPFDLHEADCIPPQYYNTIGATMTLRHYGPVAWADDGSMPVTIEYRLLGHPTDPWTDITDDFSVTTGPTNRDVVIVTETTLDFDAQVEYRVKPVRSGSAMLRCVNVGNGLVPVADYEYIVP